MGLYYITFRSVTFAQRGEKVLSQNHIRVNLLRTPRWMEEQGCGYCLRLKQHQADGVVRLLRSSQVGFRKVYVQSPDGSVEEVTV